MSDLGGLPTGEAKARAVRDMFDRIAPRYDRLNRIMTFGMDVRWRRRTVRALELARGSLVLDIACGTGDLCDELMIRGHEAIGFDYAGRMLALAHTDVPLVQADALTMPIATSTADGVTCGFALRNVIDLDLLFEELARITRPRGRAALLDVAMPQARVLRAGYLVYFHKIVPLIGSLLSDRDAYRYLPKSTAYLPPTTELLAMLERAGWRDARALSMGMGAVQLLTATRA